MVFAVNLQKGIDQLLAEERVNADRSAVSATSSTWLKGI